MVCKMKDETTGVLIKEFVGLKLKMYSFLVDDCSEHKNSKYVNRIFVEKITHIECKNVLSNPDRLRHLMNRIQIIIISLLCFYDRTYIQNNEYDRFALSYQS